MAKSYTLRAWEHPLKAIKADSLIEARQQYAQEFKVSVRKVALIFEGEAPIYKAHQTPKGWQIFFHETAEGLSRPVDGGKVYPSRQNAYAKADRLNHPIKYALKKTGMAAASFDGYTAGVNEEQEGYSLYIQKEGMPPHFRKEFATLAEVEQEMRDSFFPQPINWYKVKPEEI